MKIDFYQSNIEKNKAEDLFAKFIQRKNAGEDI